MRYAIIVLAFTPALIAAPPDVAVCRPVEREVTDFAEFTGRIEPSASVDVRARVSGFLDRVLFKEGSEVKKGDLLFQLDDRLQRAEMTKVQAEVTRAEARLKQAEADHQRIVKLVDAKGAGRDELDKAAAALAEAKASVEVARATLEVAKLNLDYTRIAAPISGRIGRSRVDAGNVVRGDGDKDGALATIIVADPVHVAFDVDERTQLRLRRLFRERGRGDEKVPVSVGLADEKDHTRTASVDFVDPRVDPETGAVRMRAVLANPKGDIIPGQFARVRVPIGAPRKALLVPGSSIVRAGLEASVLVVSDKNTLAEAIVRPGALFGQLRVIEEGLKADQWFVLDPRGRKAGDAIKPRRESAPPEKLKPEDPGVFATPSPVPELPGSGPAIVITADYPGATAQAVAEAVAGPIEAKLDGLAGVVHRVLACTDDGKMRITLVLKRGTDLNKASVETQKCVSLAEPTLPDEVRRVGVKVAKRPVHLLAVALRAPDGRFDRRYLARYAETWVRDELAHVADVAAVTFFGDPAPGPQVRLEIDPDRLKALGLTSTDVANALRDQNLAVSAGTGARLAITVTGRVADLDKVGDVAIKSGKAGQMVFVKDVGRPEVVSAWGSVTGLDGKPCTILLVARAADVDAAATAKAVRSRLAELAMNFPVGIEYKIIEDEP